MPAASNDASRYLAGSFALDVIGKGRPGHSIESVTLCPFLCRLYHKITEKEMWHKSKQTFHLLCQARVCSLEIEPHWHLFITLWENLSTNKWTNIRHIEHSPKVMIINNGNETNWSPGSEARRLVLPTEALTLRLCVTAVFVSQVNTGLIRTRAAQEMPSKCSATLPQEGRRASTPIRNLRGYEATSMAVTQVPLRRWIHNAVNALPFPRRSEYPTGPRRVLAHGSVNLNGGKLWVHLDDFWLPSFLLYSLSLSKLSSPPITLLPCCVLFPSSSHLFIA